MPVQIVVLVALTIGCAAAALLSTRAGGRAGLKARLDAINKSGQASPTALSVMADEAPKTFWERALVTLGRGQAGAQTAAQHQTLRTALVHAGFRRPTAVVVAHGTRVALMIALPAVCAPLLLARFPGHTALALVPLVVPALVGHILPVFVIGHLARGRIRRITSSLPDVLDLLVLCVEAGLGLNAAIARVAEERAARRDPVGDEFKQLANELRLGVPRKDALRSLADRTGSEDVRAVVAHLVQTERLGGNVGPALRAQADMVRTRRRLRAEEIANKMSLKMLLPMVCFMPALFIVIIVPVALRLVATLAGKAP